MCIGLVAIHVSLHFPLIVLHNRDEFHNRKSFHPRWSESAVYSGLDEQSQGSWLGVDKFGHFAFITNYRDFSLLRDDKKTRGELVFKYLTPKHEMAFNPAEYNNFNFVAGNRHEVSYFSSMTGTTQHLKHGIFSVSNAYLDTPWPKTVRIKKLFETLLSQNQEENKPTRFADHLFEILADQQRPEDKNLPQTGIPLDAERLVSSIFVQNEMYGTRASTVLLQDENGHTWFFAREFDPEGKIIYETKEDYMASGT